MLSCAALLTGCPGGKGHGSGAPSAVAYVDEVAILRADTSLMQTSADLQALALDKTQSQSMRYTALRKLEESGASSTVPAAEGLALDPSKTETARFLRQNAIGVLVRSKSEDGKRALEKVKASSLENAVLVARITPKEVR